MRVRHGVEWSDTKWILVQNEEVSVIFLFDKFPQQLLIWSTKTKKKQTILPQMHCTTEKIETCCHKPGTHQVIYLRSSS